MDSIPSKRKRSPNWLTDDKLLLLSLVEEHFHIIENKKTDGVSMKTKLAEWKVIAAKFNSQTAHGARTPETLKAQWESMKKNVKKEEASLRMDRIKTGGGPPKPRKEDPIHGRILRLIETAVIGMYNPYDGDCLAPAINEAVEDSQLGNVIIDDAQPGTEEITYVVEELQSPLPENDCETSKEITETSYKTNDWGDWGPGLLRTPISKALQTAPPTQAHADEKQNKSRKAKTGTSRRRPTVPLSTLEQLHTKKIETLKSHDECMAVTHKLDVGILQERLKQEEERLKQEKIKTRISLLEWKIKRKQLKNLEEKEEA